jgi:hypothetical protein
MSTEQQGGMYKWQGNEKGFVWEDDGKYKNMIDIGALWYARVSLIIFVISVVIICIMALKLDGDITALKQAIIARRQAFWYGAKPAATA